MSTSRSANPVEALTRALMQLRAIEAQAPREAAEDIDPWSSGRKVARAQRPRPETDLADRRPLPARPTR